MRKKVSRKTARRAFKSGVSNTKEQSKILYRGGYRI